MRADCDFEVQAHDLLVDPILTSLLLDCRDDLLPTLSQIVNDSLLSGSFTIVSKHAVEPVVHTHFSESLLLTTATLRTTVQSQTFHSCPKSLTD